MSDACHWNGHQRVTARHDRECVTSGCAGCEPCRESHCACGRHLRDSEPLTCSVCVGRTRQDLQRINDLCSLVSVAATEGRVTSELMVLAGPVAEHSTHAARRAWAYKGGLCRCLVCPDEQPMPAGPVCEHATDRKRPCTHHVCRRLTYRPTCPGLADWLDYADDEQHPLWVLGTWEFGVAEHLAHDRRDRVTVAAAVAYLDMQLTYLAQDATFAFDELAREIRDCREHVEQVMGVAPQAQRGAPCPTCRGAGRRAKPLERDFKAGATDQHDEWVCPTRACDARFTLGEYDAFVYRDYLGHAKHLTAAQILAQYRVPEATVRQWAVRGKVERRGKDQAGRQLYDVAQVVAARGADERASA